MPKAKSRAQARLFGAIAGGRKTKASGMSKKEAKERLRGVDVGELPKKKKSFKRK